MNMGLLELKKEYKDVKRVNDYIYQTLKTAIIREILPSGYWLQDDELASFFQVSRTPVQKALLRLECEELIKKEYSGYIVIKLDMDETVNVLKLLNELYTASLRLALGQKDNKFILMLNRNMEKCEAETNMRKFRFIDGEFHLLMTQSTGNTELLKTLRHVFDRAFLMRLHEYDFENATEIQKHTSLHRQMVSMISAKEKIRPELLLELMEEHNAWVEASVLNSYESNMKFEDNDIYKKERATPEP